MNMGHYELIAEWFTPGMRVCDLGCGDGDLLELLRSSKQVRGIGVDIDEEHVAACIERDLQVINADIEDGLELFGDASFDCAVLTHTLQEMRDPQKVLKQMLRIGARAIVLLANAGHWRKRLAFLSGSLPQDAAAISRLITVADFERLCADSRLNIVRKRYLAAGGSLTGSALRCEVAAYLLADEASS